MTRSEHLQWCKDRALHYANDGDLSSAAASMMSDLAKHPETASNKSLLFMLVLPALSAGDSKGVIDWITGFN